MLSSLCGIVSFILLLAGFKVGSDGELLFNLGYIVVSTIFIAWFTLNGVRDVNAAYRVVQNQPKNTKEKQPNAAYSVVQNQPNVAYSVVQNQPNAAYSVVQNQPNVAYSVVQNQPNAAYSVVQNQPNAAYSVVQNQPKNTDEDTEEKTA